MVVIDRNRVKQTFADYVENYDASQEKIKLKINHTYRVAALCDRIARSLKLSKEDIEFAWLCGMLHDVGRFEQVRRYNTFDDSKSMSHAMLSAQILFDDNKIYDYIDNPEEISKMLRNVIEAHSLFRVPEEYDEKTKLFANILRDADKVDIFKVNVDSPIEDIYNVTTEELMKSTISEKVMESFYEEHCINRNYVVEPVDHVICIFSFAYELVFDESLKAAVEQGYLFKLINLKLENQETMEKIEAARQHMKKYISNRIGDNGMSNFNEKMYEIPAFIYEIAGSYYAIGQSVFMPITDKTEIDNLTLLENAKNKNNERQITKYTEKITRIANTYRVDSKEFLKTKDKLIEFLTKLESENPAAYKKLQDEVEFLNR